MSQCNCFINQPALGSSNLPNRFYLLTFVDNTPHYLNIQYVPSISTQLIAVLLPQDRAVFSYTDGRLSVEGIQNLTPTNNQCNLITVEESTPPTDYIHLTPIQSPSNPQRYTLTNNNLTAYIKTNTSAPRPLLLLPTGIPSCLAQSISFAVISA